MNDSSIDEVHAKALHILSRREHSSQELAAKLAARGFDRSLIEEVLEKLVSSGLQSDLRFTELLVSQRARKGFGELYISKLLRQHGVDRDSVNTAIKSAGVEWEELASDLISRKFSKLSAPVTVAERSKIVRFLQSRGFTDAQIRSALDNVESVL